MMLKRLIGLVIGGKELVIMFKKKINVSRMVMENDMCFLEEIGNLKIKIFRRFR